MQLQLSLAVADRLHETLLVRGEPLGVVEAVHQLIASDNASILVCRQIMHSLVTHDARFCWAGGGDDQDLVSLSHWEVPDPDLWDVPFVALDLETTGARPGEGKITEIGAVRIEGLKEVRLFSTLVNPMRPIPAMITHITGITQEMVAGAPRIEEVIPELLEFLQGAVVVAHNAPFDVGFLNYELRRLKGRRLGEGAIDTLPLARALAPGLPNYRLGTVADALGAPVAACHRALADARAAGHVFVTLVCRLQEQGITRLNQTRSYVSPSMRSGLEKLGLTRDVPRSPGAYLFLDQDEHVLYVGKADKLRERVRSYFVSNSEHARKVRQAIRLVERIDWEETVTPLEAVVREQELILEHRPPCNLQGRRPENYAYVKIGGSGSGLNLYVSGRPPKWLAPSTTVMGGPYPAAAAAAARVDGHVGADASAHASAGADVRPSAGADLESESTPVESNPTRGGNGQRPNGKPRFPLVLGPFRGRTRVYSALDLLQRCYPIRRCPRKPDGQPCVRGHAGKCLAPCSGGPQVIAQHDALVSDLLGWLTGNDAPRIMTPKDEGTAHPAEVLDPVARADEVIRSLSRQCRYEDARAMQEAREDLLSLRRSYAALAEARALCFAALWPPAQDDDSRGVRLNLVWNGKLTEAATLTHDSAEQTVREIVARLPKTEHDAALGRGWAAVAQKELDSILAVRRWYYESDRVCKVPLNMGPTQDDVVSWGGRVLADTLRLLPAPAGGS